jgi:hypothetical protein
VSVADSGDLALLAYNLNTCVLETTATNGNCVPGTPPRRTG